MESKKEEIEQRLVENKQERKQLKQQLKDLPSLEVGKWYKYDDSLLFLMSYDKEENYFNCYGWIGHGYNYCYGAEVKLSNEFKPATDKEVEEALHNEGLKMYNVGDDVGNFNGLKSELIHSNSFNYHPCTNQFFMGGTCVMEKGKWAEIIQTKTVELNGNYTEVQLKDILNSQF